MTAATGTFETWVRRRPAWAVIARKEFTDHLLSARFVALLAIMGMVALATVYTAAVELRDVAPQTVGEPGLFLRLFTVTSDTLRLSFLQFIGFLAPILGIAYGFDAVNVGTGVPTDVNQLEEQVRVACRRELDKRNLSTAIPPAAHGPARAGDLRSNLVSHRKAQAQWGWKPEVEFSQGIDRTAAWFASWAASASRVAQLPSHCT